MNLLVKILVMIGSSVYIGFGIWRFFVPKAWKWYSYIDINVAELVAAVWAINAFFSLSLVLFGIVNILLIYGDKSNSYACCNMYIVVDKDIISGYLPTRFTVSRSSILNVVSLCDRYSVLPDLFTEHIVSKNPCLTPVAVGNCSPMKNKPQRTLSEEFNFQV